jgi:translation initiation factor IF-2
MGPGLGEPLERRSGGVRRGARHLPCRTPTRLGALGGDRPRPRVEARARDLPAPGLAVARGGPRAGHRPGTGAGGAVPANGRRPHRRRGFRPPRRGRRGRQRPPPAARRGWRPRPPRAPGCHRRLPAHGLGPGTAEEPSPPDGGLPGGPSQAARALAPPRGGAGGMGRRPQAGAGGGHGRARGGSRPGRPLLPGPGGGLGAAGGGVRPAGSRGHGVRCARRRQPRPEHGGGGLHRRPPRSVRHRRSPCPGGGRRGAARRPGGGREGPSGAADLGCVGRRARRGVVLPLVRHPPPGTGVPG